MKLPTSAHCLDDASQESPSVVEAVGYSALSVGHAVLGASSYALCTSLDTMAHDNNSRLGVSARLQLQTLSRKAAGRTTESFHKSVVASASCECPGATSWASNLVVACAHFVSTFVAVGGSTMLTDRVLELSREHPKHLSDEQAVQELVASVTVLVNSIQEAYESTSDMRRILDTLERDELNKLLVYTEGMNVRSDNDLHLAAQACVELVQNMVNTLRDCVDRMHAVDSLILPEITHAFDQKYRLTSGSSIRDASAEYGQFAGEINADLTHITPVDAMKCPQKESSQRDVHGIIDSTKKWVDAFVACSNHYVEFRSYVTTYKSYLNVPAIELSLGSTRIHVDYEGLLAQLSRASDLMRQTSDSQKLYAHQITCLYNEMYEIVVRDQFMDLNDKRRGIDRVERDQTLTQTTLERATVRLDVLQVKNDRQNIVYENTFKFYDPTTIEGADTEWMYNFKDSTSVLPTKITDAVRDANVIKTKLTELAEASSLGFSSWWKDDHKEDISDVFTAMSYSGSTMTADVALSGNLGSIALVPMEDLSFNATVAKTAIENAGSYGVVVPKIEFTDAQKLSIGGEQGGAEFIVITDPKVFLDAFDAFFGTLVPATAQAAADDVYEAYQTFADKLAQAIEEFKAIVDARIASSTTTPLDELAGPAVLEKWKISLLNFEEEVATKVKYSDNERLLGEEKLKNAEAKLAQAVDADQIAYLTGTEGDKSATGNVETVAYQAWYVEFYEKECKEYTMYLKIVGELIAWFGSNISDPYHKVLEQMRAGIEQTTKDLDSAIARREQFAAKVALLSGRADVMKELMIDALSRCQNTPEERKVQCRKAWLGSYVVLA